MRTNLLKVLGVAVVSAAVCGALLNANPVTGTVKKGDKAPAFSATGTDGKTHTLASLSKTGPVFLYFIKEGCPVNHRAAPHMTKTFDAYKAKGTLVGVYNGDTADAKKWASQYGAKYVLLADPDMKIIQSYGAPYSPFLIEVGKDGKVAEVLEGLSSKELDKFNKSYAKSINMAAISSDWKGAPSGGG